MCVPVIESVVETVVGIEKPSTAIDCAMRIGPLEAELAAKQGRELTDLSKLDSASRAPNLGGDA
jgi:hypothetical protein